jgi:hypothetical protein
MLLAVCFLVLPGGLAALEEGKAGGEDPVTLELFPRS